jgi:hypothetical protein
VGGRVFGRCYTRPTRGDHANALGGHPSATLFVAAFGEGAVIFVIKFWMMFLII